MMMNCFCVIADRRKAFSLISSRDHYQGSSPSRSPSRGEQDNISNRKKVFVNKKLCKTSHTLQIDDFEIPDNKNIAKLFSKNELLFLDQVSSNSDPSQILTLQFRRPRASLPPSLSLSYFTLANWNPSLIQSSSCSSSDSLFCPTPFSHTLSQLLDTLNHIPSQANETFYQAIHRS